MSSTTFCMVAHLLMQHQLDSYSTGAVRVQLMLHKQVSVMLGLTHCIRNRLYNTIYWKSPISILGTSGYEICIFLEKNG